MIIEIPDIPISKNVIRSLTHKGYYSQIKRLRHRFELAILVAKNQAGITLDFHNPPKKLSINVMIYKKVKGGRLGDSINYIDELMDSLVKMGVLYNDCDNWGKLKSIGLARGKENKTVIEICSTIVS